MAAADVKFNIRADASGAIQSIKMVNTELMKINGQTAKVTTSTNLFGKASSNLGDKMKGLALRFIGYQMILNQVMNLQQKVVQGVIDSVDAFRALQLQMAEIASIMASEELPMMNELTQGIQALSMEYGVATKDMSKGFYEIISAAFDAKDGLNLLTTATRAAIAGLSDITTSVDIFTTVLNAYGMSVYQATRVSDVLFQSVIRGKFQFEDLESALGYLVPIASQVGIAFEEMMAALSTATRFGLHIDMASRGLAMAIQGIINPSNEAAVAADKYGVEMSGLALEVLGLEGWFRQLNEASEEFGSKVLSEIIPNIRSLRVAMVLAGDEGLAGFDEDLQKLAEMGNKTAGALEQIMGTSSFMQKQLEQDMEQIKRDVGEGWDAGVLAIQRGILGVMDAITGGGYESPFKDMFKVSGDDVKDITNYLTIIKNITDIDEKLKAAQAEKTKLPKHEGYYYEGTSAQAQRYDELDTAIKNYQKDLQDLTTQKGTLEESVNRLVGSIEDELDVLGQAKINLMDLSNSITEFEDKLVNTKIYGWGKGLKEASVDISEFISLTDEQRKAIEKLGGTIKGTSAYQYELLKADQMYADVSHDVQMGLKTENYNYKTIPDNIRAAIEAVREFTEAEKRNKQATDQMSAALRILQIEQLEIQLKGMIRRRGLTHAEERRLKQIQIEEAKIRLANMKAEENQSYEEIKHADDKQQIIDDYLAKIQEEQYVLKYNYDQQIADLENAIGIEAIKLNTRYEWWDTTNQKIIDTSTNLMNKLKAIMAEDVTGVLNTALANAGINLQGMLDDLALVKSTAEVEVGKYTGTTVNTPETNNYPIYDHPTIEEAQRNKGFKPFQLFHTGTSYVPATKPYMLEKGEKVLSKNVVSDNNTPQNNITVNVNNPIIKDDYDLTKVARTLDNVVRASLINKQTGKSKFRMA